MGVNVASTNAQNTITSFTKVINDTVSTVSQNIQGSCGGTNIFKLRTGIYPITYDGTTKTATFGKCEFNVKGNVTVGQNSTDTCGVQGSLTNDVVQDINTNLVNNITQWLNQNATANGGLLQFGISIAQSQGINQTQLVNQIANDVTSNLVQNCSATVDASNLGDIWLCGNFEEDIVYDQSVVVTNLTSCTVNNTVNNIGNDSVINSIFQQATEKADAEGGFTFTWLTYLIIGIVIIVVIIIIGAIILGVTYLA